MSDPPPPGRPSERLVRTALLSARLFADSLDPNAMIRYAGLGLINPTAALDVLKRELKTRPPADSKPRMPGQPVRPQVPKETYTRLEMAVQEALGTIEAEEGDDPTGLRSEMRDFGQTLRTTLGADHAGLRQMLPDDGRAVPKDVHPTYFKGWQTTTPPRPGPDTLIISEIKLKSEVRFVAMLCDPRRWSQGSLFWKKTEAHDFTSAEPPELPDLFDEKVRKSGTATSWSGQLREEVAGLATFTVELNIDFDVQPDSCELTYEFVSSPDRLKKDNGMLTLTPIPDDPEGPGWLLAAGDEVHRLRGCAVRRTEPCRRHGTELLRIVDADPTGRLGHSHRRVRRPGCGAELTVPRKVAILGGGMAGLSAAWELSAGDWTKRFDAITVYQRGGRLGGKAASTRGAFGRIEEHGLHVWMGYYDNAFRLVRECYEELDRARTDPTCPIATWRDAFEPAVRLGVADGDRHWIPDLPSNGRLPGAGERDEEGELVPRLLGAAGAALRSVGAPPRRGLVLSASPHPPPPRPDGEPRFDDVAALARDLQSGAIGAIGATLTRLSSLPATTAMDVLAPNVRALRALIADRLATDRAARRAAEVIEMLLVMTTGLAIDGVIERDQLHRLDGESGRAWLARHGASAAVLDGPMMRGFHDLVFGYEDGDPSRPTFPAGLGVQLMTRMFFGYEGSLAWRMRAGMGDVVIAPLYQALCRRGVQFRFFHDVEGLRRSPDGSTVDHIDVTVQAETGGGELSTVHGLPVFAAESAQDGDRGRRTSLRRGVDFDVAVLAIPVGALGRCAAELVDNDERWRAMVTTMSTVATQSLQVWLRPDEAALGWPDPGAVVAGGGKPFDTYASMSHLLPMEAWPSPGPQSLGYFCSVLPDGPGGPAAACARVGANAAEYLATRARSHWPGLGADDVIAQYWTANVDPSDRYVQATPASSALRLSPDRSGYANLVLAGDWTDSGLNAGCIEAAVLSGVQAAAALNEEGHRELGGWR